MRFEFLVEIKRDHNADPRAYEFKHLNDIRVESIVKDKKEKGRNKLANAPYPET